MIKINQIKSNKNGITLVALVITIAIMLILASANISILLSGEGLLFTAHKTEKDQNEAIKKDEEELNSLIDILDDSEKKFYIWVVDQNRLPIEGATIEIYSDQACKNLKETIDMTETGFYDHSNKILENGKYYVKETKAPDGFNEIEEPLEFEITGKEKEEWFIINVGGMIIPNAEMAMLSLEAADNGNIWTVNFEDEFAEDLSGGSVNISSYRIASTRKDSYMKNTDKFNGLKFSRYDYDTMLYEANQFIVSNNIRSDKIFEDIMWGSQFELDENLEDASEIEGGVYLFKFSNIDTAMYTYHVMDVLVFIRPGHSVEPWNEEDYYENSYTIGGARNRRLTSIAIESDLLTYNPNLGSANFVYEIIGTDPNSEETVYDNIVGVSFDSSGTKRITIEGLPMGCNYMIRNLYRGSYDLADDGEKNIETLGNTGDIEVASFVFEWYGEIRKSFNKLISYRYGYDEGHAWSFIEDDGGYEIEDVNSDGTTDNSQIDTPDIEIDVEVRDGEQHIKIMNVDEKSAFVRMKIIANTAEGYQICYSGSGQDWALDDGEGYYFYGQVLNGGESTEELIYDLTLPNDEFGQKLADGTVRNVYVIAESAKVHYREDGSPYVEWGETVEHDYE